MAYTPNNIQVYTAAFTGAASGIMLYRKTTAKLAINFAVLMRVADAVAQAIDTLWGGTPSLLDIDVIQTQVQAQFAGGFPTKENASFYSDFALTIMGIVTAAQVRYAAEGITPPPLPISGSVSPAQITPGADGQIMETVLGATTWGTPGYSQLGSAVAIQDITPQEFQSTVDAKGVLIDRQPQHTTTNDATPKVISFLDTALFPDGVYLVTSCITATKAGAVQGAAYIRTASFRVTLGVPTQLGTTQDGFTAEDDPAWDATISAADVGNPTQIQNIGIGKAATNITWVATFMAVKMVA